MAAAWYYRSSADICRDSHFKYAAEMFWKLRQTYVGHWPVFHFEKQKEKKNLLFKLWGSCGKTITDSVYLRWSYTAQRKSNHAEGFSPTLEEGTTNIPKPMPGRVIVLYTFFLLLYEEWSNQARKRVSSVCRREKRDFQNNPLSRWGCVFFFMYYFLFYCEGVFQDSRGNDNYCPGAFFVNGRTFFFCFFFPGSHEQLLYCMSAHVMWPCYYSVSWQVIFCQMKCWIASYSEPKLKWYM